MLRKLLTLFSVVRGEVFIGHSELSMRVLRHDGKVEDLGVVCRKKVTVAFVNDLVDELQAHSGIENYKYHDYGTGTTGEDNTDTAMETACGEARTVGSQTEGASANIYKTVATHTFAGTFAITEHGIFNASSAGTLMDRSVFAAINVVANDKIESTYQLTINAEA